MDKKTVTAIILAAGSGTRMGSEITKQRMEIFGESVLHRSVRAMNECESVDSIIVAVRDDEVEFAKEELLGDFSKLSKIIVGGKSRAESAAIAFSEVACNTDFVAIHDAARCLVTPKMITDVIDMAKKIGAATAGSAVTDTVKHKDTCGMIDATLNRDTLFFASTPQVFSRDLYKKALSQIKDIDMVTDDNMLVENIGEKIAAVDLGRENIKITTPDDIGYAEYLIMKRSGEKMEQMRVGHGYDVHKFAEERDLILGGVKIPYELGLLGHSDADVLTHAIMDALLGAAALGDIGRHFPDTSEDFRGISSMVLLEKVGKLLSDNGYSVVNIDATLILQKPKIAAFVPEMVKTVATTLGITEDSVNIKATTEEKLGFTGSGEGAAAHAVVLLKK